ncbi:MAG: hypothetical protein M1819_001724 [Sarea resinae]|nr:MAG: hypothetical protein M1819_001724 [Sarea resinae]
MASPEAKDNAPHVNFDVDWVISYRFADIDKAKARAEIEKLLKALGSVGLMTEVRAGNDGYVLILVKIQSEKRLSVELYRSRVKDWLFGFRPAAPDKHTQESLADSPTTPAERLRIVYLLVTNPTNEGGAGITPKKGQWKMVESVFALHDHEFNKKWIKKWSTSYFLTLEDLDQIRDHFGEKVAYYFAFLQTYFRFLIFPALIGFSSWVLLGHYSPVYAIINGLWGVVFVEYWKRQEVDLGVRWEVRGVSAVQTTRQDFKPEKEAKDPVTGEVVPTYPATKRLARQLLQIPFALVAALALGTIIATCFAIEIFISEIYNGPLKSYLTFLPTVLISTLQPTILSLLTGVATRLTDFENYETDDKYEKAMTQKVFVLNVITSYLPIFLTAFVYVPFGSLIVPYLDLFSLTVRPFAENEKQMQAPQAGFMIDPARLKKQVIYFTVTAQIVNFAMENIVPYIMRQGFRKYKDIKRERAAKSNGAKSNAVIEDPKEEVEFLTRVRNEAELAEYDVTEDLREMCIQFGYLTLFSVVFPLTPVSFIINNWVELRSDAIKICVEMQRPTPWRADSIGPWLDSLGFLTWLGSISTAALVYLFSNDGLGPDGTPKSIKGWALLLTIIFSEHVYFLVRLAVRVAVSKIESPGLQKEHRERYIIRKRYLEESSGEDIQDDQGPGTLAGSRAPEKFDRASLEEDARQASLNTSRPEDHFWRRQRSWEESAKIASLIVDGASSPVEGKKQQ